MVQMGISLGLSPREPYERIARLVKQAEDLGVDGCWVIDSQLAMKDAYVMLAILAHETQHIELGPGVTNLITRHETVVGNAMNTLATIAPGRINVGLGSGDSSILPLGHRTMRIAECEEGMARLRALLDGGTVAGPNGDISLSFRPDEPPPIYFAATQPKMLALAGRAAQGAVVMGPSHPDMVRMQFEQIDAGAREAGRNPGDVSKDLWVTMSVGEGNKPVDDVKSWASAQARLLAPSKQLPDVIESRRHELEQARDTYAFGEHLSLSAGHADVVSDELARVLAVAGTFDECAERLHDLAELGPDRITITLLSGGREQRLETIARLWDETGLRTLPSQRV